MLGRHKINEGRPGTLTAGSRSVSPGFSLNTPWSEGPPPSTPAAGGFDASAAACIAAASAARCRYCRYSASAAVKSEAASRCLTLVTRNRPGHGATSDWIAFKDVSTPRNLGWHCPWWPGMLWRCHFAATCQSTVCKSQRCKQANCAPEAQADEGVAARCAVHQPQCKVARAVHYRLYGLSHK